MVKEHGMETAGLNMEEQQSDMGDLTKEMVNQS